MATNQNPKPVAVLPKQPSAIKLNSVASPRADPKPETAAPLNPGQGVLKSTGGVGIKTGAATPASPKQGEKGPVTIHRTDTGAGAPAKTAGATTVAKPATNGTGAHGAAHAGDNPAKKPAGTTTPAAGATSPKVAAGGEHKAAAGATGVNATPKTTAPKTEAAKAPAKTAGVATTGANATTGNTAGTAGTTVAAKKTTTEQPKTASTAVARPAGTEAPKAAAGTTSTVAAKKTVATTATTQGGTTTAATTAAKKVEAPKAATTATDPAKKPVVAAKKLTPTPPTTDKPADKPAATEKTTTTTVPVETKAVTKDPVSSDNSSNALDIKHTDSPKSTADTTTDTNGTSSNGDESAGRVYVQPVTLPAELLPGADDPSLPPPPGENGAEPASPKAAEPKKATPLPTGFRKPEDSRGNLKAIKAQHDEKAATNPTPIKTEIVIHPLDLSRNDARRGTVAPPPPDELPPPLDNEMPPPPPDEMPPPPEDPVPVVVPKEVAKPEKTHHDTKPEKASVKTLGSSSRNLVTETKTETKEKDNEKDPLLELSTKTHIPKELAGTESTLEDDTKIPIAPLGPDGQPLDNLDGFELGLALKALANDNVQLVRQLEEDESQMATLRANVVHSSRRNFILERELNEIDEKIKLLIKNRITVQEIVAQQQGLQNLNNVDESGDSLKGKLSLYEDLFYLLQTKPVYFARLARLLTAKNIPPFVQTVVFDLYGDQYETREERLLLALFKLVLQAELEHCTDQGSLLRANTAITQMLSAYARRGQGLSVLKDILEQPLKSLTARKDLNLEINPSKIYAQLITDYETKTGKQSPLPRAVPDEVAAANTEVQAIVAERSKELQKLADYILTRIMDGVESIPYGVRWTCKQLGELSKKRFPDSDRYQIGSLIGGYIYLRFFNPVIATPDSVNFISVKPSKNMRRNLVLIAKVLQNLSNGILFGDKEQYMKPLNKFIQERMDPLQDYFDRLISVDDLEDSVAVDKLMEHTQRQMPVIQISLNQIFLLHSLCEKHAKVVAPDEKDPLHNILKQLGPAPPQIADKAQNRTVALQLTDRRQQRIGTAVTDGFASPKVNPLYIKAKQSLLELLKKLPTSTDCTSIMEFLEDQKDKSNPQMAAQIDSTVSMLKSLVSSNLMTKGKTLDETYNMFLWAFAQEAATRRKRISQLSKKMTLVKAALKSIETHFGYLQSRLELYKVYLDNARKGQAGGDAVAEKKLAAAKGPAKVLAKKFTHPELVEQGVLTKVLIEAPNAILKKCYYVFTMDSPGKFKVEVHVKQGVDIKLLNKPIELVLEDLLQKQERHEREIEVDAVQLNVNLLIHLLNTHFVTKA